MQGQVTFALIPHASKILLHILNERMRPHLERELPEEQARFRRGKHPPIHRKKEWAKEESLPVFYRLR